MNYTDINGWLGAAALVVSIINTLWVWISKQGRETAKELDSHEKKLIELDRRTQKLENEQLHLPKAEALGDLRVAVTKLDGQVSHLDSTLGSLTRVVTRIDDYMRGSKA